MNTCTCHITYGELTDEIAGVKTAELRIIHCPTHAAATEMAKILREFSDQRTPGDTLRVLRKARILLRRLDRPSTSTSPRH